MKAKDRNSYMNRACRELMNAQRRIEQGKAESGIVGLMKQRMGESSLEALRMVYGQPSLWDQVWPKKPLRVSVDYAMPGMDRSSPE